MYRLNRHALTLSGICILPAIAGQTLSMPQKADLWHISRYLTGRQCATIRSVHWGAMRASNLIALIALTPACVAVRVGCPPKFPPLSH